MTYIVSSGALNSTHSLTPSDLVPHTRAFYYRLGRRYHYGPLKQVRAQLVVNSDRACWTTRPALNQWTSL